MDLLYLHAALGYKWGTSEGVWVSTSFKYKGSMRGGDGRRVDVRFCFIAFLVCFTDLHHGLSVSCMKQTCLYKQRIFQHAPNAGSGFHPCSKLFSSKDSMSDNHYCLKLVHVDKHYPCAHPKGRFSFVTAVLTSLIKHIKFSNDMHTSQVWYTQWGVSKHVLLVTPNNYQRIPDNK